LKTMLTDELGPKPSSWKSSPGVVSGGGGRRRAEAAEGKAPKRRAHRGRPPEQRAAQADHPHPATGPAARRFVLKRNVAVLALGLSHAL
jgi:hypothetical protein